MNCNLCSIRLFILIYFGFSFSLSAQVGKVGINTTSPSAMLHVKDSSVVFTAPNSLPGTPAPPPLSGTGNRFMWYADKAALRGGKVFGSIWNKDSIGLYSIAYGFNAKAKGENSVAFGLFSAATGDYSTAFGNFTTATGTNSTAMGSTTLATGLNSTALGDSTIASGIASIAMGKITTASGNNSTALGRQTIASGNASTAMGNFTTASGHQSTAMGNVTTASGDGSIALGFLSMAGGTSSAAMGFSTTTTAFASAALGNSTLASGLNSMATGMGTIASGTASISMGHNSTANSFASLAIGRYNDTTSVSPLSWIEVDPVFAIGNGISGSMRSNAFTVLKNGKTGINTASPDAMLHIIQGGASGGSYDINSVAIVESTANAYIQFSNTDDTECGFISGSTTTPIRSALVFGADSTLHLRSGGNYNRISIENNGNIGLGVTFPTHLLELAIDNAGKPGTNTWTVISDARLKKNIHLYQEGLKELVQMNPVWFTYTGEAGLPQSSHVGVLAQDLQDIAPHMVGAWNHKDEDGNTTPYLSVNNGAMTYMLINAVKEQQEIISRQQEQIDSLLSGLNAMKQQINAMKQ